MQPWTRIAAYAWIVDEDRLLLCRLSSQLPDQGRWTLPGGGVEHGEHPEQAMMREVLEETGLSVIPKQLLAIDSELIRTERGPLHAVRIFYSVIVQGGDLQDEAEGTTDKADFIPLKDLNSYPCVSTVYRARRLIGRA